MNTSIHAVAYEEIKNHGGLMPLRKIYELVLKKFEELGLTKPKKDSIRGALIDKTAIDPLGRTGRKANGDFLFERVSNGVYKIIDQDVATCVLEGDGRNLSVLENESVHCIVTDHPWEEGQNHRSGNQKNFAADYEDATFKYSLFDFVEKARVLKEGGFLVENVPAENGVNSDYLMSIRKNAKKAGFELYAVVPWKKFAVPKNTGRTQKDREYLIFFTKGKPRRLAPTGKPYLTTEMIPAEFNYPAYNPKEKIHQAEKPIALYEHIIRLITLPGEVILDHFAGSGNVGKAAFKIGRNSILIELLKENVEKIKMNLGIGKALVNP